ncbi:MAG: DUF2147 domain-containing protein [Bacteroidota bacterium]
MLRYLSLRSFLLVFFTLGIKSLVLAQKEPIERLWYNDDKTAKILVYKANDGTFYGKIVWLKEPLRNGKPKMDDKNPDPAKRTQPTMGLFILKNFKKEKSDLYVDGSVYNPRDGKTYSSKMTYNGNELDIRGFIGIPMFGKTTVWTKTEDPD